MLRLLTILAMTFCFILPVGGAFAVVPDAPVAERSLDGRLDPGPIEPAMLGLDCLLTTEVEMQLAQGCCRVCRTGKACGESCINRSHTCRRPPGCACNG